MNEEIVTTEEEVQSEEAPVEEVNETVEETPEQVEEANLSDNHESNKSFETTEKVSFIVNGKKFEGTSFTLDSEEEAFSRKAMLVERYGVGVIK